MHVSKLPAVEKLLFVVSVMSSRKLCLSASSTSLSQNEEVTRAPIT